jgi:signal transduction histidine kinase
MSDPLPPSSSEDERLDALRRLDLMDSLPEEDFNDIVTLASEICGTPIGLVSLVDGERQWFKARVGLAVQQTPRDQAFCAHALLEPDRLMIVEDAEQDERFVDNPLVTGAPDIRFYAGAPIFSPDGFALGTVCVIDTVPRTLSPSQAAALKALARQTSALIRLRAMNIAQRRRSDDLQRQVTAALADDSGAHAALQQRHRVASIGQLTSGLAHDFNNLLQTINGSLQLILRKAERPDLKRWAGGAMDAVARGAKLTSHLLAFSRSNVAQRSVVEVDAFVAGMRDLLERALGPEIQLTLHPAAHGVTVNLDVTQLEAAVLNLCVNARDAMCGAGTLQISTSVVDFEGDATLPRDRFLVLEVGDSGPGMPAEVVQRAFEPFFTTKGDGVGTGLGLAQVYGFALQSGGIARIHVEPGRGTTVALWLKASPGTGAARGAAETPRNAATVSASGARVLLVDDDAVQCATWCELLVDAGYQARGVFTGRAALDAIADEPPDVVIVDRGMPVMNGSMLAQEIDARWPSLPLIFVTGQTEVDGVRPPLQPPPIADAQVLTKPLLVEQVTHAIEAALGR